MTEENFAQDIREVAIMLRDAEYRVLKTEADVKRVIAKAMLEGEMNGNKSAAAQARYADESDAVYAARLEHGVAKGDLAYAKAELKAREVAFEYWRTKAATLRLERKAYNT